MNLIVHRRTHCLRRHKATAAPRSSLRPMALAAALSLAAAASSSIGSLTSCTSRRPYGELKHNYRTLYVPASLLSSPSAASLEWAESLCCVYTRVEEWTGEEMAAEGVDVVDSASKLRRYDGEEEWYAETSFEALAQTVFGDICDMTMGSADCAKAKSKGCLAKAHAAVVSGGTSQAAALGISLGLAFGMMGAILAVHKLVVKHKNGLNHSRGTKQEVQMRGGSAGLVSQ